MSLGDSHAASPGRVSAGGGPGRLELHVEGVLAQEWATRCLQLRDGGAAMLDFLTAVDHPSQGELEVIAHLVDLVNRERWLVRTRIDREPAELESLTGIYLGADWHEREVTEMFGITFAGHPGPRPLLTTGDVGHPLRRTTPLPVRAATLWPGSVDPSDWPVRASSGDAPGTGGDFALGASDDEDLRSDAVGEPHQSGPPRQVPARPAGRSRAPARPPGIPEEWSS